jgi:hypothetical protein
MDKASRSGENGIMGTGKGERQMERAACANAPVIGPSEPSGSPARQQQRPRPDTGAILVLLLLTGAIHTWLIRHTEVLARDGVGYIHYAWRLQHEPWGEVLRSSLQHPGYPLTIAIVSKILPLSNGSLCDHMILSAQLANLAAGCLLAVAMFYLGKELFNWRVGFWTAAVFQCLPVVARVTSDVLSEATFLLTATLTLLLAVRSLRDYSIWRLGLCGACGGFCFLIRPEGGLTVLAVAATLFGLQATSQWRRPWRQVLPAAASLTLAAILVAAPYVAILGQLTNKPTSQKVLDLASEDLPAAPEESAEDRGSRIEDRESKIHEDEYRKSKLEKPSASNIGPQSLVLDPHFSPSSRSSILHPQFSASLWAVWWHADREGGWLENLAWAVWALTQEAVRCFGYVAWLPAVLGLYWCRGQWRKQPEILILGFLCLFQALVLCRVGLVVGYVSERHVLIIVLCGLYWAVWAILSLAQSRKAAKASVLASWRLGSRFNLPIGLVVAFMLACLPVTLQPLHANQIGHRQAGLWLAQHTQPCDIIVDPFDWAYFYAGRVFRNPTSDMVLPSQSPKRYVVLETSPKPHPELIMLPEAKELAVAGQLVYDWQPNRRQLKHRAQEVLIFAVPIPNQ